MWLGITRSGGCWLRVALCGMQLVVQARTDDYHEFYGKILMQSPSTEGCNKYRRGTKIPL